MTQESREGGATSEQEWPKVTMYSTAWCGDCRVSKRFLTRHGVPFEEINIEEVPEGAEVVRGLNNGRRTVPTILIEGGPTLTEPSDRELGQALGIA